MCWESKNEVESSGQDGAGPVPVRNLIRLDLVAELRLLILCTMYCGDCVEKHVTFNVTTLQPMTLSLRVNSASCHQILPFLSLQNALSQDLRQH